MVTVLLIAAVAAAILWPSPQASDPLEFDLGIKPATPKPARTAPSYPSAIESLSVVRKRLAHTSHLTDQEREAISLLTLALVSGSEDE